MSRQLSLLAGFILIPYGAIGCYKATELLRRGALPVADAGLTALLGVLLVFAGLGLILGSPIGVLVVVLLVVWRGLAMYNARLRHGWVARHDLWPAAAPDVALALLTILGSR